MEQITFIIRVDPLPNGMFGAQCLTIPDCVSTSPSHNEAVDDIVEKLTERFNELLFEATEIEEDEAHFIEEAFRVSQKHTGDAGEWLPLIFTEEGVHLGEPGRASQIVPIQFGAHSEPVSPDRGRSVAQKLATVAI